MGRRKGIVDIEVAVGGEPFRKSGIVLLLARIEAEILEHGHVAGVKCAKAALGFFADAIADEADRRARHQLLHFLGDRPQ